MTSERSQAYGRVLQTLADIGPTKLLPDEQDRVRATADSLLFCEDADDGAAVEAIGEIRALLDHLVGSDRWTEERADQLALDLLMCGPVAAVV